VKIELLYQLWSVEINGLRFGSCSLLTDENWLAHFCRLMFIKPSTSQFSKKLSTNQKIHSSSSSDTEGFSAKFCCRLKCDHENFDIFRETDDLLLLTDMTVGRYWWNPFVYKFRKGFPSKISQLLKPKHILANRKENLEAIHHAINNNREKLKLACYCELCKTKFLLYRDVKQSGKKRNWQTRASHPFSTSTWAVGGW
jgi:hypothetical protein